MTRTSTDITHYRSHQRNGLLKPLLGLLLPLLLLSGCLAVPVGLRGVPPSWGELFDAHKAIVNYHVPQSRLLKEAEWRPTLNRVLALIGPSARETCYLVGANHCELVGQQVHIVEDPTVNAYVDQNNVNTSIQDSCITPRATRKLQPFWHMSTGTYSRTSPQTCGPHHKVEPKR